MVNTMPQASEIQYYLPKDSHTRTMDDRREINLLRYVYSQPNLEEMKGSPQKVLNAIDAFGKEKGFLMNVGQYKGKVLTDLIAEVAPQTMIELGTYVGYSAILFGDALRRVGGKQYYSLELHPEFAAVATMLVDLAGLRDFVKILVGNSDVLLHRLWSSGEIKKIELMFLDHFKGAYITDLKLCEQLDMIVPGTVLAADNVIMPGNPIYLEYVRSSVQTRREKAKLPENRHQSFSEKVMPWYVAKDAKPAFEVIGNPNLIYESKLIEGIEPCGATDGIEITLCVGVQKSE